ncbi:MAG: sn-glycerol-3-phosphate ABC transporter ATP-binding protein UgpC [Clostridia bacterium]|nr:sn-glycerol-3-phosphate ABC transporter ATP-binding protein UgpC [Clostridia bacterium]
MSSLTLNNVSKIYSDGYKAVDNFNLNIPDKEFLVLVGPSGCGKSTTLRMIAGLEAISSGEISIGERVVNDIQPKDRDIAMVFQSYALYPDKTVYKNIAFSLERRKMPKKEIDSRVREAAKILHIEHLLDRKPKALSGGQRQRVALGRAIVRNPAVFLFDEPLSNLDAKLRTQMRTEISLLHKRLGTTFIYVTHDQTEAMTMGDRIVVMDSGVIQQTDTPENLYHRPANKFVASFIGSPSMNFLEGTLEKNQQGFYVKIGSDIIYTDKASPAMEKHIGENVTLGVRPEDITVGHSSDFLKGILKVQENLGSEAYIHIEYGNCLLTARVPEATAKQPGDEILFGIKSHKCHIFSNETGLNLTSD